MQYCFQCGEKMSQNQSSSSKISPVVIAAVITTIGVIIAALIPIIFNQDDPTPTPPPTNIVTSTNMPATQAVPATPEATPIPNLLISLDDIVAQCQNIGDPGKFEGNDGWLSVTQGGCPHPNAIKMTWDVSNVSSFAGCTINLPATVIANASDHTHLILTGQVQANGGRIIIELVDGNGDDDAWPVQVSNLESEMIVVPLSNNEVAEIDLGQLEKMIIAFRNADIGDDNTLGSICIEEIGFGSP
jgi:hypothetical protein